MPKQQYPAFEKVVAMVRAIYQHTQDTILAELMTFSKFTFEENWNVIPPPGTTAFNIKMHVDPDVYIKRYIGLKDLRNIILSEFKKVSDDWSVDITILPDYDKINLVDAVIQPIYTEWDEINRNQQKLVDQLRRGAEHIDFQNIGNTARTILQQLADIVYDPHRHAPPDTKIGVSAGNFKNRLNSYIRAELQESDNEDLRKFAEAQITAMEKTIDLANATTHKLNAKWPFAESCVVGTISVISVIKVIDKSKGTQ